MTRAFCPRCNSPVVVIHVECITITRHRLVRSLPQAAICVGCSLTSELSDALQLIDLGSIRLTDLDAPFVPGVDTPRAFLQAGSSSLWRRRDS